MYNWNQFQQDYTNGKECISLMGMLLSQTFTTISGEVESPRNMEFWMELTNQTLEVWYSSEEDFFSED